MTTLFGVQIPPGKEAIAQKIIAAARARNINPRILLKIAERESGFDMSVRGAAGEVGMFQMMPDTLSQMGITAQADEDTHVNAAARYYRWLLDHPVVGGNQERALVAYNWGIGNMERVGGRVDDPRVPTMSRDYADFVLGRGANMTAPAVPDTPHNGIAAPRKATPTRRSAATAGEAVPAGPPRPDSGFPLPVIAAPGGGVGGISGAVVNPKFLGEAARFVGESIEGTAGFQTLKGSHAKVGLKQEALRQKRAERRAARDPSRTAFNPPPPSGAAADPRLASPTGDPAPTLLNPDIIMGVASDMETINNFLAGFPGKEDLGSMADTLDFPQFEMPTGVGEPSESTRLIQEAIGLLKGDTQLPEKRSLSGLQIAASGILSGLDPENFERIAPRIAEFQNEPISRFLQQRQLDTQQGAMLLQAGGVLGAQEARDDERTALFGRLSGMMRAAPEVAATALRLATDLTASDSRTDRLFGSQLMAHVSLLRDLANGVMENGIENATDQTVQAFSDVYDNINEAIGNVAGESAAMDRIHQQLFGQMFKAQLQAQGELEGKLLAAQQSMVSTITPALAMIKGLQSMFRAGDPGGPAETFFLSESSSFLGIGKVLGPTVAALQDLASGGDAGAKARLARIDAEAFVAAVKMTFVKMFSGAAVTKIEFENLKPMLPQPGDSNTVKLQKLKALEGFVKHKLLLTGRAAGISDEKLVQMLGADLSFDPTGLSPTLARHYMTALTSASPIPSTAHVDWSAIDGIEDLPASVRAQLPPGTVVIGNFMEQ